MRWFAAVCVLVSAALWGWALLAPVDRPHVPEELVGEYVYEGPAFPEEPAPDPRAPNGRRLLYEIRADGTFRYRELVGRHEILRREGLADVPARDLLVLTDISVNRRELEAGPDAVRYRYSLRPLRDEVYLGLTDEESGTEAFYRRLPPR